jgi:RNA polymerase sigma-70 factor, ECF subfamily
MTIPHTIATTTGAEKVGGANTLSVDDWTQKAVAERFQRDVIPLAGQIMTAAMRLTSSRQDAEDLTQEVMLHAYAGFGSFRAGTNVRAWLFRILRNSWISQYRKKKCRPHEVSVECVSQLRLAAVDMRSSTALRSVEDFALEAVSDDEVAIALAALQDEVRTTVYYADVLGFSYKEIAAMMDSPIGTVMSRLHRGRNRLRASLFEVAARLGVPGHQLVVDHPHHERRCAVNVRT